MKKKSLLILVTTCMTVGAASVLIANSVGNGFNYSDPNSGAFESSSTLPTQKNDDDTYQFRLDLATKGAYAYYNVTGANEERVVEGNITTDGMTDVYFYNTTPFRGISSVSFDISLGGTYSNSCYFSVTSVTYFSYNPLNLEDIFAGKYQDLVYHPCSLYLYTYFNATSLTLNTSLAPQMDQTQYCLEVISIHEVSGTSNSAYLSIDNIQMVSVCEDELTPVGVGENYGVLSTQEKQALSNGSNGQLSSIDQVGNGSYKINLDAEFGEGQLANQLISATGENEFLAAMTSGFELTYSSENYCLYQKQVGDDVYSLMVQTIAGKYTKFLAYQVTDIYSYVQHTSTWPQSIINSEMLYDEYKSRVIPISSEMIEEYVVIRMDMAGYHIVEIDVVLKSPYTMEDFMPLGMEYYQDYLAHGFTQNGGSGTTVSLKYDSLFSVQLSLSGDRPSIALMEEPTLTVFPTAEEIADRIGANAYSGSVVPYNGNGRFSEVIEDVDQVRYTVYGASPSDFTNYKDLLVSSGYIFTDSSSHDATYECYIDELYESSIRVFIHDDFDGDGCFIRYTYFNKESNYYEYSREMTLENIFSYEDHLYIVNVLNDIDFGEDPDPTFKYSFSDNRALIFSSNESLLSELTATMTYDELSGGYYVSNSNDVVYYIKLVDGVVTIKRAYNSYKNLQSYAEYNSVVDNFIGDENDKIFINESDNIPNRFQVKTDTYVSFIGSQTEVEDLRDLLTSRATALGLVYSSYLDRYVDESTGYAYSFEVSTVKIGLNTRFSLDIKLYDGVEFKDYKSINELGLNSHPIINLFGGLIGNADEKLFVVLNDSEGQFITIDFKKSYDISALMSSIISNGFVAIGGSDLMGMNESNGHLLSFSYHENEKYNTMTFSDNGAGGSWIFKSADDLWVGNEDLKEFADEFYFTDSNCFISNTPTYSAVGTSSHEVDVGMFNNGSELENYKTYLLNHGYEVTEEHESYYRLTKNVDGGQIIYTVNLYMDNPQNMVALIKEVNNYVSWSELETDLIDSGHDYNNIKDNIPYPTSESGVYYELMSASKNVAEIKVSSLFDITAYKNVITNHEEYVGCDSGTLSYRFNDGMVKITQRETHSLVKITKLGGKTFESAIEVSTGSTPFLVEKLLTYFVFVPEEDGNYAIYGQRDEYLDTYGYLYNSSYEQINYNDDAGGNGQFRIVHKLIAGETYYIGAKVLDYGNDGLFDLDLVIEKIEDTSPSEYQEVYVGNTNFHISYNETSFRFIPEESGYYFIQSTTGRDSYLAVYNYNFELVDDFNESNTEKNYIYEYFETGSTYYISTRLTSGSETTGTLHISFEFYVGFIDGNFIEQCLGTYVDVPIPDNADENNSIYNSYIDNGVTVVWADFYEFSLSDLELYFDKFSGDEWEKIQYSEDGAYFISRDEGRSIVVEVTFLGEDYGNLIEVAFYRHSDISFDIARGTDFPEDNVFETYIGKSSVIAPDENEFEVIYQVYDKSALYYYVTVIYNGTEDDVFLNAFLTKLEANGYHQYESSQKEGVYYYYNSETEIVIMYKFDSTNNRTIISYYNYNDVKNIL